MQANKFGDEIFEEAINEANEMLEPLKKHVEHFVDEDMVGKVAHIVSVQ